MADKVLMKGNEAIAEAAIKAGCRHYFGYPITPQTEIAAYMAKRMPKIGGTFLQAESEIAAINMVYGVASTGKPAMTSSSSPGISLKCEGSSYLAGADRRFRDRLIALHQYFFCHSAPYLSTVMMQSGHMIAQEAQPMHASWSTQVTG